MTGGHEVREGPGEPRTLAGPYSGLQLKSGDVYHPPGGVEVFLDKDGRIVAASFIYEGAEDRWRYTIPVDNIGRLYEWLGKKEDTT